MTRGKEVLLFPRVDEDGLDRAEKVKMVCWGSGPANVCTVKLEGLGYGDADSLDRWILKYGRSSLDAAIELGRKEKCKPPPNGAGGNTNASQESQAKTLLRLADSATLFRDPGGRFYASVPVENHTETHEIRSSGFRRWLTLAFYTHERKPPSAEALQGAIGVLEARAQFEGLVYPVFIRVAELDSTFYLDLGDDTWSAIKISDQKWEVVKQPGVKFRRPKGLLPLPTPAQGASIDSLKKFVNLADGDFPLLVAYITACFRSKGPYPVLNVNGEQGSAKSTLTKIVRKLIDPHVSPMRSAPKEPRDLAIAAHNNWLVAFNNLGYMPGWLSDGICCLSTGGGYATRTLYSDLEETFMEAERPCVLNAIADLAERGDLIDRCVYLYLPAIEPSRKRKEEKLWKDFDQAHPALFGALLDAVVSGLRKLPSVKLDEAPRMCDFAHWGEAVCRGIGLGENVFVNAYKQNRQGAIEAAVEDSLLVAPLRKLLGPRGILEDSATSLLRKLTDEVDDQVLRSKSWPKTARKLSGDLRKVAPQLRAIGIDVQFDRGKTRTITITLVEKPGEQQSAPSAPSGTLENKAETADDMGTEQSPDRREQAQCQPDRTPTVRTATVCIGVTPVPKPNRRPFPPAKIGGATMPTVSTVFSLALLGARTAPANKCRPTTPGGFLAWTLRQS